MQQQAIEITIHPDGRVEYTIKGVKGSACESISALLEQLGRVQQEARTGEYYEQERDAHLTLTHD
jgi:predicted transcriptional regulator